MQPTKLYGAFSSPRPDVAARRTFWPMTIIVLMAIVFVGAGEANGHEFEDGFVERSVAVVVRDNVARLEYSIGLNPNTRQQLIEFWQSTDGARGEMEGRSASKIDSIHPVQQNLAFYSLAAEHLSRRLDIVVNNQRIEHNLISALQSSRHHVDVTVILEFNLPSTDAQIPIAIEIADGNFFRETTDQEKIDLATRKTKRHEPHLLPAPFGGGFRYAFKTAGSTVLSSTNVASILIRADRQMDDDFTDTQLDTAFKIKAKVINIRGTGTKR